MAPLPKILKIGQHLKKTVLSKVVDYNIMMFTIKKKHGYKALHEQKVNFGISAPPEGPMDLCATTPNRN